jgi:hypothetical protein
MCTTLAPEQITGCPDKPRTSILGKKEDLSRQPAKHLMKQHGIDHETKQNKI